MSHIAHEDRAGERSSSRRPLRRAWISVGLMPLTLILAVFSSEAVYRLAGYEPMATVTLWFDVAVWAFILALFAVPSTAAILYGREVYRFGDWRGRVPILIGSIALLLVLAMAVHAIVTSEHL